MITFVDPENQYKPSCGDVLWGAAADWAKPSRGQKPEQERISGLKLNQLEGNEFDNEILLVCHVDPNPMKAMDVLGIDKEFFCPRKDSYTGFEGVFGIIPTAVLSNDVNKYKLLCKPYLPFLDLAFDQDFVKETCAGGGRMLSGKSDESYADIFELSDIQNLMMGRGYTYGCSMHDGHGSKIPAKVKMSNGDWLFVWVWEWYNK